jgi:8-oxo-dGTP pyrophosphatase MutT (NUDIX family)
MGTVSALTPTQLQESLAEFHANDLSNSALRHAAVAIVVGPDTQGSSLYFLLTERSSELPTHAGQFALPGGKVHVGERFEAAAIREIREEVGLSLSESDILGRVDDYETRSGFLIRTFVVWAHELHSARPDASEVACLLHIPLAALAGPGVPTLLAFPGQDKPVLQLPLGGDRVVHAPTGAILYQFARWVFAGQHIRTDAFAEPSFAWQ